MSNLNVMAQRALEMDLRTVERSEDIDEMRSLLATLVSVMCGYGANENAAKAAIAAYTNNEDLKGLINANSNTSQA